MKIKSLLFAAGFAGFASSLSIFAADKPNHGDNGKQGDHTHEKKTAGPNGGRILTKMEPHAEFFVTKDRKVQITFLGEDGKAIAPAGQNIIVTAGDRASPTKLTFTQTSTGFLSDTTLPAGNNFPAVVQIYARPDAKPVYEKLTVNLAVCAECSLVEYACICGH